MAIQISPLTSDRGWMSLTSRAITGKDQGAISAKLMLLLHKGELTTRPILGITIRIWSQCKKFQKVFIVGLRMLVAYET